MNNPDGSPPADRPLEAEPGVLLRNAGEPLKLSGVKMMGVAGESGRPGQKMKVVTKLATTSDDPFFHLCVEGLRDLLRGLANNAGKYVDVSDYRYTLLVIHPDETADLWLDAAAVAMKAMMKRPMQRGSVVFENDIVDVTAMQFPLVKIEATDRLLCLFREGWRWGLYFDFNPEGNALSVGEAELALGRLHRHLKFRHLYDAMSEEALLKRLMQAGWFPFAEIIGKEFRSLVAAEAAGFDLAEPESEIFRQFDEARLNRMYDRWKSKAHFQPKDAILRSALDAYNAKNWIAVCKIALSEIEGILREAYRQATGNNAKLAALLKFAAAAGETKAGGPDTLLFAGRFGEYLASNTFANFDPRIDEGTAGSRHAVGHGAARAESYTQARALQALLTLDQFAFYT